MADRRCKARTKRGTACKTPPMKEHDFCMAHAPEDLKGSKGFGGKQPGSGRPPNPNAIEMLTQRIEEDIDAVIDVLWDGLTAEQGIALTIKGGGMRIETIPDHLTRLRAAREILDRGYGRAKQVSNISIDGRIDGKHTIEIPDTDGRRGEVLAALARSGLQPAMNGNGNGHLN